MVTVEGWKEMGEPVCTEVEYCEWTLNNKHQIFSFRASFLFLWGGQEGSRGVGGAASFV